MKFKIANDQFPIDWRGTSLQGYIQATRRQMVKVFGAPQVSDDSDIKLSWEVQFENGAIARIYDWREKTPVGLDGEIYAWRIGALGVSAVALVHDAFREAHHLLTRPTWPDAGSVRSA